MNTFGFGYTYGKGSGIIYKVQIVLYYMCLFGFLSWRFYVRECRKKQIAQAAVLGEEEMEEEEKRKEPKLRQKQICSAAGLFFLNLLLLLRLTGGFQFTMLDVGQGEALFLRTKAGTSILVDGGILNPLPLNHAIRTPGDLLVAVDVNAPSQKPGRKRLTPYQLATKSSRLMMQQITRYELAQTPPDLLIQLCGEDYDMMEFYHAEEIIKAGRRAAKAALCR